MITHRSAQALKYLGSSLLLLGVFEACSGDDAATPNPFHDPPTLEIASISLGSGSIGQGGDSSVLACDETIGVTLAISNWYAYPLGKCGTTPQCGQIRINLLDGPKGAVLATKTSASVGVDLDVAQLVADGKLTAGSYTIQAELVDDAGAVNPVTNGGNKSVEQAFNLTLSDGCPEGTPGMGGSSDGGMGGSVELPGASGEGGAAGHS